MSFYFKSKTTKRKKGKGIDPVLVSAAGWVGSCIGSLYITWALCFPSSSGLVGRAIDDWMLGFFGYSAYLLPVFLAYGLFLYFTTEKTSGYITYGFGSALTWIGASTGLALIGALRARHGWGGDFGEAIYDLLHGTVGTAGAAFASLAFALVGLKALFGISWRDTLRKFVAVVRADYAEWTRVRKEFKEQVKQAKTTEKAKVAAAPAPAKAEPDAPFAPVLPPIEKMKAQAAAKPVKAAPAPKTKPTEAYKDYQLPPLDLLKPKSNVGRSGPDEAEIRAAVESLDATLASFEIGAKVSGISPGPVITRYEVSPAPGVTVASIVARSNDIALAMKARGIRMIAPIPGKAAIGIEIPNQNPAGVTLREILESPAITNNQRPLAFALGLSSDGTPLAADLGALPHLLIAGATNSGKSVMMHSLIQSILFRARPDEVKFLMIDPKRIELSLYDGIPHLFDPKTPPDRVGVITHSKEAAKSLKAMITVMESRYEKFQAYKARDIESFNAAAAKRGEPPEYYIVVVIDELADLMVVSRDIVEDSIQRLAQMARAVGIHLVLATQRPSVDVITGVIKANLPSRLALRVASKVDSKVILDTQGAEALLGKGDMLYLAPGQDPARTQGAYVSTDEIGKVVDYLKTQGKPDYALIGGIAALGAEDLSRFGVEPIELTQALELVLERRRVSQDLLKSQFGSSARATNLLSLLELKGFINKPVGTNRWEISFDQIESYLAQAKPKQPGQN